MPGAPTDTTAAWWRRAVIYEIYVRSFRDGDGDGIGDIAGIRSRLPYLRDLGIDALWVTPWYRSPMADGGYDVEDHRDIDPLFGSREDAAALVYDAHALGLRVLLDLVPNHTSDRHPWFRAALAGGRGSRFRARYHFQDGRGPGGHEPPNDWPSVFGGPGWHRVTEPDGRPGQWYLHVFAPEQPDLDWSHPAVRAEYEDILASWFDLGVDGFRIDVAHAMAKQRGLPDLGPAALAGAPIPEGRHPHWHRPGVHAIHRGWRRVAERFGPDRLLLGEIGGRDPERIARYLRGDGLHLAFDFPFTGAAWDAAELRAVIRRTLRSHGRVGAVPTWLLSNHDATRQVTRLGRPSTGLRDRRYDDLLPADLEVGTRRARAAILLALALPGAAVLYQGEELGLPEVEDIPEAALQDPIWERSGRTIRGRDGCRVPLPWSGVEPPFGFGPPASRPWLPQPPGWRSMTVEAQSADPASMLSLYRDALRLRRSVPDLAGDDLAWVRSSGGTLHFGRGDGFGCLVNLSSASAPLPQGASILLTSAPLEAGRVPPDAAAWYRRGG